MIRRAVYVVLVILVLASSATAAVNLYTRQRPHAHAAQEPVKVPTAEEVPIEVSFPVTIVEPTVSPEGDTKVVWNTVKVSANAIPVFWQKYGVETPPTVVHGVLGGDPEDPDTCHSSGNNENPFAWSCHKMHPERSVYPLDTLTDDIYAKVGYVGIAMIVGHEFGHIVLPAVDHDAYLGEPDLIELRADCAGGAFLQWLTAGELKGTKIELNEVNTAIDTRFSPGKGNWEGRRAAYHFGMANDPKACATYTP